MLSNGIPTIEDYLRLDSESQFPDLKRYSEEFERSIQRQSGAIANYRRKWVGNPFLQWSRRWEYTYTAQRISHWTDTQASAPRVIDAGSGFTFFPFYLMEANPELIVECLDTDQIVGQALFDAGKIFGNTPSFHCENLERLQQNDAAVDAVYSISVIEHTKNPFKVIEEIHRVLKPGGHFVCTFDISFEKRSPMNVHQVTDLLSYIESKFRLSQPNSNLSFLALPDRSGLVTTEWIARSGVAELPWRYPLLVYFYDLLKGRLRTEVCRPMTFICSTYVK